MKGIENKLRVVHFPQLGLSRSFQVEVKNEREAYLVGETIANQHLWLFENNIIPDYCNTIVVEMFCDVEQEWKNYYNDIEHMDWDEVYSVHENGDETK